MPLSAYLGAVGMPGVTAWYGLMKICQPKAGQTIVVSAASGAVGSAVGQLAKARGCRAVGIAGGADKCGYVTDELGFDACIDYKAHPDPKSLYQALKEATPDGVDGCFENVGGTVLDAVLARMNAFGRIALCGMISGYDGQPIPLQQPQLHPAVAPDDRGLHRQRAHGGLARGAEGARHDGRDRKAASTARRSPKGSTSAPEAFLGLLKGRNFGKQLVKLV